MLPLTKRAAEIVNARPDPADADLGPEAHVFGNELGEPVLSIKTAFEGACRRAGIEDLHFTISAGSLVCAYTSGVFR